MKKYNKQRLDGNELACMLIKACKAELSSSKALKDYAN